MLENACFTRAEAVNFLNPEHVLQVLEPGRRLGWRSVTTGNLAGIDLWLGDPHAGTAVVETQLGSLRIPLESLDHDGVRQEFGGLGRAVALYRLPEQLPHRATVTHHATQSGAADLPVYVRVTQTDGNQAWSSPIYLIN